MLRNFSRAIQSTLRDTDVLARWGGEEFLLVLNDTSPEMANLGIERARMLLAQSKLSASHPDLKATFSAGLTAYSDSEPLHLCIDRADRALYMAKSSGRNRTVVDTIASNGMATLSVSGGIALTSASR